MLKALVKRTLAACGYRLERIDATQARPAGLVRRVINAYYRGNCLKCFQEDCLSNWILAGKGWDNQLEGILDRLYTGAAADVVEIGANIGASLVPIAAKYPQLTFHCVEPVPDFHELLAINASTFGAHNVRLYREAIAASDGELITLYTQLGTAGALEIYDGHVPMGSFQTPTSTVDTLFSDANVILLKIDVDGFEHQVLRGAVKTIERCHPAIFLEFSVSVQEACGTVPQELLKVFETTGYNAITIWDNFGVYQAKTRSYTEVLAMARRAKFYVDLLLEWEPAQQVL